MNVYTQLENLCNIKVKQGFELIMSDIEVIYATIFINDRTEIMA